MRHVAIGALTYFAAMTLLFYLALSAPTNNSHAWEVEKRILYAFLLVIQPAIGSACIGSLSFIVTESIKEIRRGATA